MSWMVSSNSGSSSPSVIGGKVIGGKVIGGKVIGGKVFGGKVIDHLTVIDRQQTVI